MSLRTDLAIELEKQGNFNLNGVKKSEKKNKNITVTEIEITEKNAAEKIGKPEGKYITLEFISVEKMTDYEEIKEEIKKAVLKLLPPKADNVLVVGLGNTEITSDSIGPLTAEKLLATRHIAGKFAEGIGLSGLKSVSVIAPNVLGKTGIESSEIISALAGKVKPDVIIAIDALAAGSINRLFTTVQLCNTGISPGSGVKNSRKELSKKTLGIPVIAVGVPTVVEALTLAMELTGKEPSFDTDMIVTPKDADLLVHRLSEILASCLNHVLQPLIDPEIIDALV